MVEAGGAVPDFDGGALDGGATGGTGTEPDTTSTDSGTMTFRLENATPTPVDIVIDVDTAPSEEETAAPPPVRVPGGEISQGKLDCGDDFLVSATIVDADSSVVTFTGDGTGTAGFDGASVGQNGERLIQFVSHYACGGTVVVRVTDDGSGIGGSTSEGAA